MKTLIRGGIIDKLQATFPPNRIVVLLGGVLTALSSTIAAWIAAHCPGLNLGAAEIAGVLAAAAIVTVRLLDRWIDQWQRGEQINTQVDLEAAFEELADGPEVQVALAAIGTLQAVELELAELRARIGGDSIKRTEVFAELESIGGAVTQFLHEHELESAAPPAVAVAAEEAVQ